MTQEQRSAAFAIADELPYTGFSSLRINATGRWISPADSVATVEEFGDSLAFVWDSLRLDDEGNLGTYRLPA